jgi:hypothetical protein
MQTATAKSSAPHLEELGRNITHVTFGYGNVIIS